MPRIHLGRPSPAMVVALIALFVALAGSGYAAVRINGRNIENRSIAGKKIVRDALTGAEVDESTLAMNGRNIERRSLPGSKLRPNTLTRTEIAESQLGLQRRAMWAMINAQGDRVLAQSGGVSVASHPAPGRFFIRFPQRVKGRAIVVTPVSNAAGSPRGSADAKAVACGGVPNQLEAFACEVPGTNTVFHAFVATFSGTTQADVPFFIVVLR